MMKIKFKVRKLKKNWKPGDELVFTEVISHDYYKSTIANLKANGLKKGDKVVYLRKHYDQIYCSFVAIDGRTIDAYIPITALLCHVKTTRTRKVKKVKCNVNIENQVEAEGADSGAVGCYGS